MKEEIYHKLLQYLEKTEDFLLEQSPQIMQEALRYHKVSNTLMLIVIFIAFIFLTGFWIYLWKNPEYDKYESYTCFYVMKAWFSIIFVIPLWGIGLSCIDTLLKIYLSPKYFLIGLFS